jgi:hypothetical protein
VSQKRKEFGTPPVGSRCACRWGAIEAFKRNAFPAEVISPQRECGFSNSRWFVQLQRIGNLPRLQRCLRPQQRKGRAQDTPSCAETSHRPIRVGVSGFKLREPARICFGPHQTFAKQLGEQRFLPATRPTQNARHRRWPSPFSERLRARSVGSRRP